MEEERKPQLQERITHQLALIIELEAYKRDGITEYRPTGRVRGPSGNWFDLKVEEIDLLRKGQ